MTNRTWQPTGANVRALNPGNWSGGAPAPGDTLQIYGLTTRINIYAHDLAADPIRLDYSTVTANLSRHAAASIAMGNGNVATFNVSGNSTLDLTTMSGSHVGNNPATVNISGVGNLTLHSWCSPVSVHISTDGRWNGTVNLDQWFGQGTGLVIVNGEPHSTWNNNGASIVDNAENLIVFTDVVGEGSFDISNTGLVGSFQGHVARMEFVGAVGSHQEITDSGLLVLDRPRVRPPHISSRQERQDSYGNGCQP